MRSWPRLVSLALGLIPVVMLLSMLATIAFKSRGAITEVGLHDLFQWELTTRTLNGYGRYGLLAPIVGTVSVVVVAIALALPVSLAIGVASTDFTLGPVGRGLRVVMSLLSGIPPIVYALMAVVFASAFMIPKFTGGIIYSDPDPAHIGADPNNFPPQGLPWNASSLPWDPYGLNSTTLLGGILLALLVIPVMAPLIEDALRIVPRAGKEASLALGANRWYTLRRVTLPRALPGIVAATGLGALRAMGDVLIVLFVIGRTSAQPKPFWDLLEANGPLTSAGAASSADSARQPSASTARTTATPATSAPSSCSSWRSS